MRFEHAPYVNYEDLASGHVLHSAPGYPAFPVRLTLELFERARQLTGMPRVGVWDPMCGAGSIPTTLGLLRPDAISRVLATDVSKAAAALAGKNLELLTNQGLRRRSQSLAEHSQTRAAAAQRLLARQQSSSTIATRVAVRDATQPLGFQELDPGTIDLVITDLPYGRQTTWTSDAREPSAELLGQLRTHLPAHALIVLCSIHRADFRPLPQPLRAFKHGSKLIKFYRAHGS